MGSGIPEAKQPLYNAGRRVRDSGGAKVPPAKLNMEDRHWWLAGWHDRDLELTYPTRVVRPQEAERLRRARDAELAQLARNKTAVRRRLGAILEEQELRRSNADVWEDK